MIDVLIELVVIVFVVAGIYLIRLEGRLRTPDLKHVPTVTGIACLVIAVIVGVVWFAF